MMEESSAVALGKRILDMRKVDAMAVRIERTETAATRFALNRVTEATDGAKSRIEINAYIGGKGGTAILDRADDESLRRAVAEAEDYARQARANPEGDHLDEALEGVSPTDIWFPQNDSAAIPEGRGPVVDQMLNVATASPNIVAAGYIAFQKRARLLMNTTGYMRYARMTDTDCTMTARTSDGTGSGWAGQSYRKWTRVNPTAVAEDAVKWAKDTKDPTIFEPGRYTVILSPTAMGQLLHFMLGAEMDAFYADHGMNVFSKKPTGNKWGKKVLDDHLTISSDPDDPEDGFQRFDWGSGFPLKKETWVESGVLRKLTYGRIYGRATGHQTLPGPPGLRLHGEGQITIPDMIKMVRKGFYINRLSSLVMVDLKSMLMSGVTRDGLLFIENGKIKAPARNMRFMDSMMFFLNALEGIGAEHRISIGWYPTSDNPIMIAPPVLVKDFTFTALAEAV